ncbi:Putative ribonuclease H protein At1g65750 [Linum perenne]
MTPPQQDAGDDEWVWGCEGNRRFTIRSAYNLICKTSQLQTLDVWRWKGPNKIHHFLWLAAHDQLLTNHARKRRNLINDANCHWCPHQEETVLHVLRDCSATWISWEPRPRGWVTLNSDGAVNTDSGKASAGGLIRDNLGMVLNAYTVNLGSCTITRAEIR